LDVYAKLGVRTVINAAGPLTRLGGQVMAPEVIAAMAEASRANVRMEELQERAGAVLAEVTGAEAGYVTSGAAAGVTLGIAACVAGLDVARMERLPDTRGLPNEVVVQRAHRNAYDHAVRAAGIALVEVGWPGHPGVGRNLPWEMDAAISERTAAIYHMAGDTPHALPLAAVCAIARRRGVPVVVDAAGALPPPENLRRFVGEGADLVAFSGGKAIGGPQASGLLVGRRELIASVALQNQDMDVHPKTWSQRARYLESGRLPGPPHQGFGRAFKAGKEEIVGLVTALRLYVGQDFAAVRRAWSARCAAMAGALRDLPGVEVAVHEAPHRPVPQVHLRLGPAAKLDAVALVNRLAEGDPPICLAESFLDGGVAAIVPSCLRAEDDGVVVDAIRRALRSEVPA
jgi:L-seryl-tRNA(Ser) seleniumtransferase